MVTSVKWPNGKIGMIAKRCKMLKPTAPKIDTSGKNGKTDECDKMVKSVLKW